MIWLSFIFHSGATLILVFLIFLLSAILNQNPDGSDFDYNSFYSDTLTPSGDFVETEITNMQFITKNNYLYFNEDFNAKYSLEQPIFVKKYVTNKYEVAPTSTIEEGDFIIKINDSGQKEEILVESINVVTEQDTKVILFSCEPQDWFIAGDNLVHNK